MSAVSFRPAAPNRGPLRHGLAPQEEDGHQHVRSSSAVYSGCFRVPGQLWEESRGLVLYSVSSWESSQALKGAGNEVKLQGVEVFV